MDNDPEKENPVVQIYSVGGLFHFKPENKPQQAAERCLDCKVQCPYSASNYYLNQIKKGNNGWPCTVLTPVPDIESITEALKTQSYGLCAYSGINDVCDNQVVTFLYKNGATATLTMTAFTEISKRTTRIFGTKGEITLDGKQPKLRVYSFLNGEISIPDEEKPQSTLSVHGYADFYLMQNFIQGIIQSNKSLNLTGADQSLKSHRLVFLAEQARKSNKAINLQ